jgi:surface antigen
VYDELRIGEQTIAFGAILVSQGRSRPLRQAAAEKRWDHVIVPTNTPRARILAAAAIALSTALAVVVPTAANAEEYSCVGDECDEFAWANARGESNEVSFWGMSAGHNCTNYIAWKLTRDGIAKPSTHPGDAQEWAASAIADGFLVDHVAMVGAIAQWDSLAGGNGVDGHVAYVERVNVDGTIVVSEDYWRGGTQVGPLTFRTIDAGSVSNFIHYGDVPDRLRVATLDASGWHESASTLRIEPTAFTAVTVGGIPRIIYVQDGKLFDAVLTASGWNETDTRLTSQSVSLSAVDMGGAWPHAMSIESGRLYHNVGTVSGWQKMNTGIEITGDIVALNLGGLAPTVMVAQAGQLWRVWRDITGWHVESTGLEVWGPIAASGTAGAALEVYSIENGMIQRLWFDLAGWHKESTGIAAVGVIAVAIVNGSAEIFLAEDQDVYRVTRDGTHWRKDRLGMRPGTVLGAVASSPTGAIVVQLGFNPRPAALVDALRVPIDPTEVTVDPVVQVAG